MLHNNFHLIKISTYTSIYGGLKHNTEKTSYSFKIDETNSSIREAVPVDVAHDKQCHLPTFLIPTTAPITLLIVIAFSRADIIELNYATALAFLPNNSFKYLVFDNSLRSQPSITHTIKKMCEQLDLKYIRVPALLEKNNPSLSHAAAVQWIVREHASKHIGRVWFLDIDMFLLRDWLWEEIMPETTYDIMTVWQRRPLKHADRQYADYIWPNFFVFANIQTIPDLFKMGWQTTTINGQALDSGGETYFWLREHPNVRLKSIHQVVSEDIKNCQGLYQRQTPQRIEAIRNNKDLYRLIWPDSPTMAKTYNYDFLGDFHILHYRSASNWNRASSEFHAQKWAIIKSAVVKALHDKKLQNDQELNDYQQCLKYKKSSTT